MAVERSAASSDIARILGLRSAAGTVVGCAAWFAFLILGMGSGGVTDPVFYVIGFAALGAGWALILRSSGDPMRTDHAILAGLTGSIASGLAVFAADDVDRATLLALGAAPAVTFALMAVRGRSGIAWVTALLSTVTVTAVSIVMDADLAVTVQTLVPGTLGVLAIATFFAKLVRPRAQQIGALRRMGERNSEAEQVRLMRDDRVTRLHAQVRPLLEYIASGAALTDEQVETCLLVEAGLRDRIRAPGLDAPEVTEAAWDARARGVRVVLLDDRENRGRCGESVLLAKVRDAAVGALVGAQPGSRVTVRLMPERRDVFGTISVAEGGHARRIDFSAAALAAEPE